MTCDSRYPPNGRDGLSGSVRSTGSAMPERQLHKWLCLIGPNGDTLIREDITGKTPQEIHAVEEDIRAVCGEDFEGRFVIEGGDE